MPIPSLEELGVVLVAAVALIGAGILQGIGNDIWVEIRQRLRSKRSE